VGYHRLGVAPNAPLSRYELRRVCVLVLSGFVLAHVFSHTRIGPAALAAKRAVRLGLPILAATLFSWGILAAGYDFNHVVGVLIKSSILTRQWTQTPDLAEALRDGTFRNLMGTYSFTTSYNYSLWTMPVEFFGSLLLIMCFCIGNYCRRFGLTRRAGGLSLLATGFVCYPHYGSLMIAGAALYLLEPRRLLEGKLTNPYVLTALGLVSLLLGTVPTSAARGPWWDALVALPANFPFHYDPIGRFGLPGSASMDPPIVCHAAGAVLLLIVIEVWPPARRVLARPLPQFLGRISFPLYFMHLPVLLSVGCGAFLFARSSGIAPAASIAIAAVSFASVSFAMAVLASHFVDKPATRLAAQTGRIVQSAFDFLDASPTRERVTVLAEPLVSGTLG
jgi:peptidoglycan/LPS O-acetylase OafA/YrhL